MDDEVEDFKSNIQILSGSYIEDNMWLNELNGNIFMNPIVYYYMKWHHIDKLFDIIKIILLSHIMENVVNYSPFGIIRYG